MKNLYFLGLLLLALGFSSCGGDDVDCSDEAAAEQFLQAESSKFLAASLEYAFNPTDSNACNNYKNAIQEYFDAIEPYRDCVPDSDKAEYDADLQEARDELDDLAC